MFTTRLLHLTAALAAIVSGLVLSAGAVAGMTPGDRALLVRSQALDVKYGLVRPKDAGVSAAERALRLRGAALNRYYGLGANRAAPTTSPAKGFAWGAFGVGAAAMLGFVFLAAGLAFAARAARNNPPVDFA